MKKRIIISITVVILVLICVFIVIKFNVLGKLSLALFNLTNDVVGPEEKNPEDNPEDFKYVTEIDKDGNEFVVEYRKGIGTDEEGNKVEFWTETKYPIKIHNYNYEGKIVKIDDNKIYFLVDREGVDKGNETSLVFFKDVDDYQIVFDLDTYDLEGEYIPHYNCDSLILDFKHFYSFGDLNFLVGEYIKVQDVMFEDYYTGHIHKSLVFYTKG